MYKIIHLHRNKKLWAVIQQVHLFGMMRFVAQVRIEQMTDDARFQCIIVDEKILPAEFTAQDAEQWLKEAGAEGIDVAQLFAELPEDTILTEPAVTVG